MGVVSAGFILLKLGMTRKIFLTLLMVCLLAAGALSAQNAAEKILPLDGWINPDGSAVELNWFDAKPPRVGGVTVKRRLYGQIGGETWQVISPPLGPAMRFTDETIEPGVAYEYQVLRSARDIVDVGYWVTGVKLPAQAQRGNIYVVVDETIAEEIAPRLRRFERDLTGDGWKVHRHLAPRGNSRKPTENLKKVLSIKTWLHERYLEDPFGQHAVVLVGHIPMIKSGRANPDGHEQVAHASDLFYADMDGRWAVTRKGVLLDNRVPGDFIETQIGRIDFSNVSAGKRDAEIHLLRAYFDKNHHWRMGLFGDLREAYGKIGHLTVEAFGLRNVVGPNAVAEGGHHDVGEQKPWLWGVDFGDWNGYIYAEQYANKAVFAINFGSGKQKIGSPFNPMTALLAQPWYTIAVGWGARPAWWLHHMALGGTIGDVHMRTVNNGVADKPYRETMDYYPTGGYLWRNPVWVNLLGDPSTRAFMLAPATGLSARETDQGVRLSWAAPADPDVIGYRLYRAAPGSMDFTALNEGALVENLTFLHETSERSGRYMVRAYGLKRVHAGSFYTLSQGAFAETGADPEQGTALTLATPSDQAVALPKAFSQVTDGKIHAVIEGPLTGQLSHDGTDWLYTPPAGFAGTVPLRFTVSDALQTVEGVLTITVGG